MTNLDGLLRLPRERMPSLYRDADDGAVSGQRTLLWLTRVRLFALILVATASVLSAAIAERPLLWVVAAAFITAVALEIVLWAVKPERRWYDGRAAAESLKTLVWRYSVRGEPFGEDLTGQAADELFSSRIAEVLLGLRGISPDAGNYQSTTQVTPEMRALRQSDLEERVATYHSERIQDQQRWYSRNSVRNHRRARVWTALLVLLECCGLVLVGLEVSGKIEVEIVAIIACLSASVVAWVETRQFRTLAEAYFIASRELAVIGSQVDDQRPASWATFVGRSEEAISREHTLWRASRGHDRL